MPDRQSYPRHLVRHDVMRTVPRDLQELAQAVLDLVVAYPEAAKDPSVDLHVRLGPQNDVFNVILTWSEEHAG